MGGLLKLEPLAEPLAKAWPKAWPKARDRLLGILFFLAGHYINKNKLAGVKRTAGMWWFLQTCTRCCMKCFESTCGFVYPVRET